MPESMAALQVEAPDAGFAVNEVDVPEIGPTDVLVDVDAAGVGLTVHNQIRSYLRGEEGLLARIPGHELVGRAAAVGDGVTHVEEGDLVGAYFYLTCGHCEACLSAREPLCENHRGYVGVHVDGGYAEYTRLPGANVVPLPGGLDPVAATVIPDAVGTPYHVADERAEIAPGDRVMVLGAGGGVGVHLVQMARYFGGEVTAVDQRGDKLARCSDLGAARTVDTRERSPADAAGEFGIEYDAVVDLTGSTDLIEAGIDALAPRGRLVNLTAFPGRTVEVSPRRQVRGEIEVVGSRYCSKHEYRRAADLVDAGEIEPVVTETVGLDGVPDLLETIAAGDHVGRGAVEP